MGAGRLSGPSDMKISASGKVAISDTLNARVVLTDVDFKTCVELKSFRNNGAEDTLKSPTGLFFTEENHLYICDQENRRILEFDEHLNFVRSIKSPEKELLPDGFSFYPSSVAVDKWGTIYCISYSSTNGYLQFDKSGKFQGFMGSPETTLTLAQKFWRQFQTKNQRARTVQSVPVNYNYMTVDAEGFVYTTEANPNLEGTALAIQTGTKSGIFMPIRKFNFSGTDVLKRNDFYAPAGDISFEMSFPANEKTDGALWASQPTYIVLGEYGTYYIADARRNKIFAYTAEGKLLYAFSGTGSQIGLFSQLKAISYYDGTLFALDQNSGRVTVFSLTEYGLLLHETVGLVSRRQYEEAAANWERLLDMNQNLTLGYVGLGQASQAAGDYATAMTYFRLALDTASYEEAFSLWREELLGNWFLAVPLLALVALALTAYAFSAMARFNNSSEKRRFTFVGHLVFAHYVIFHPFDGFWDVKHEKRGGLAASMTLLGLASVCVALQFRLKGFSFTQGETLNVWVTILAILGMAFVFCLSNWCLTSLTDGKGNMRDILTVIGYASVPLILLSIPSALLSNVLTANEAGFITLFVYAGYIWTAVLLFTGIMTMHQYSLSRNLLSVAFTLVGMVVIMFLVFLLVNLIGKIAGFAGNIFKELSLR